MICPHMFLKAKSSFIFYENEFQAHYSVSTHVISKRNYALYPMLKSRAQILNNLQCKFLWGRDDYG